MKFYPYSNISIHTNGLTGTSRQPGAKLRNKFFHRYAKSWLLDQMLSVDTGCPKANEPPLLKTRIYLRRDSAEQFWKQLWRVGWRWMVLDGNKWTPVGEPLLSLRAERVWGESVT